MRYVQLVFVCAFLVACGGSKSDGHDADASVDATMAHMDATGAPDADVRDALLDATIDMDDPNSTSLEEHARAMATVLCANLDCFGTHAFARANALLLTGGTTGEDCVETLTRAYAHDIDAFRADVAAGRVSFDGVAVQTCFESAACDKIFGTRVGPCLDDAVTGLVDVGGACTREYQCRAGTTCVGSTYHCAGTCQTSVPVGEVCDPLTDHCEPGEFYRAECEPVSGTESRCFGFEDRTTSALGETCNTSMLEGYVHVGIYCQADLNCDFGTSTCVARPARTQGLGESCTFDDCVDDLICAGNKCAQPRLVNTAGERCGSDATVGLAICNITHGLACVLADGAEFSTCQPTGDGSLGSICASLLPAFECDDGLFCLDRSVAMYNANGVCTAKRALGEMCNGDPAGYQCTSGHCSFDNDAGVSTCIDPVAFCM